MAAPQSQDPDSQRKRRDYIAKQQRWLLFLRHCAKCQAPDHQCQYGQSCAIAKQLWRHILTCSDGNCTYSRCAAALGFCNPAGTSFSCSTRRVQKNMAPCWFAEERAPCVTERLPQASTLYVNWCCPAAFVGFFCTHICLQCPAAAVPLSSLATGYERLPVARQRAPYQALRRRRCVCRCVASRELLKHHQRCTSITCPVCTPVKQYVQKQRATSRSGVDARQPAVRPLPRLTFHSLRYITSLELACNCCSVAPQDGV